ncbi:MAG: hypothetical protein XXXJIFNMEKO3_02655 [Candidatus Erwinia impunctatus]|nr:hypothetical protein XXXJIFNMEKO_02655 [Culicoides impunctatus]
MVKEYLSYEITGVFLNQIINGLSSFSFPANTMLIDFFLKYSILNILKLHMKTPSL